jgi:multisubunit Na+/H+ antiporter MnhG subunit
LEDPWTHQTDWPRIIGIVLLVIGLLALLAGIIYLTVPAHSLPSFMGRLPKNLHRSKRGVAGVVVGVVLAAVGGVLLARSRKPA